MTHASRAEEIGLSLYRRAGLSPAAPVPGASVGLAVELYGGDVIREGVLGEQALPLRRKGKQKIFVDGRLHPRRLNVAIARAIARIEAGREDEDLARFLLAPPPAFRLQFERVGLDVEELARPFAIPETLAAVRLVELGVCDGVVVTPEQVHRPGRLLSWADDETVRRLARGRPQSVWKVELDEPGCVALIAKP